MVMHARKTQRMNDGYFEKHQAHSYQSSKYGSSKSYGSSSDRYERIRDSPNGNYRSDSPDSQSPRDRDRSYQSKNYLQKIREKERENRDYKISRDKYSDCARSPKEKRSRDSEHRNEDKGILHPIKSSQLSSRDRDRKPMHNNCVDKRDDRDRVVRIGDWSEHVSSSGKKYYYNCKTEVSQWEKPREWIERERERFRGRERDRDSDRSYSSSNRSGHEKHSNSRPTNSSNSTGSIKDHSTSSSGGSRHWSAATGGSSSSSRGGGGDDNDLSSSKDSSRLSRKHACDENASQTTTQDMDISPGDSTPTSETSASQAAASGMITTGGAMEQQNAAGASNVGPVLLANALPRLVSMQQQEAAAVSLPLPVSVTVSNAPGPPRLLATSSDSMEKNGGGGPQRAGDSAVHTTLSVDTNHTGSVVEGPPTPTHSEVADCVKAVAVPVSSPPGSLSSLQGVSSSLQALRPQGPTITPSLANHYRDDLVNHVRGWPAEIIEKQAQKLAEEAHIMGSIQCSKVSAELKSARSIVRLTEIQATLQEQRILFLRQQIKELEELKSQNSFMADDT